MADEQRRERLQASLYAFVREACPGLSPDAVTELVAAQMAIIEADHTALESDAYLEAHDERTN